LTSIGKTPQTLREEYATQSRNTIALDLILNKIAEEQKIVSSESQIDSAIKASSADPKLAEKLNTPEQRRLIASVLTRRTTLDYLVSLV
jgi:FKBP-type peptidyl-prolyl cis-trans isomerase (trigger factor)